MSHFQRGQYRIAPHYLHPFPGSPISMMHPLMPLQPVLVDRDLQYGGWIPDFVKEATGKVASVVGLEGSVGRETNARLREISAVVGIWDQYNAVQDLANPGTGAWGTLKNLRSLQEYDNMSRLGQTDAGAQMKVAYWLAAAYRATGDGRLKDKALAQSENAAAEGRQAGSGNRSGNVIQAYSNGLAALQASKASFAQNTDVYNELVQLLVPPSPAAAKAAADLGRQGEEAQKKANVDKPSVVPGVDTVVDTVNDLSKSLKTAVMWTGIGLAATSATFAAYKFYTASQARSNPTRLRLNPSAAGRTDFGPENDIAKLPKARKQELQLVQNVFKASR